MIRFHKGDILLSNIRPYLKKLWFADFDGGCSPDVLVFRSKNEERFAGRFIYYAMRRSVFFDFVMQDVNGVKMPRGSKKHILDFKIVATIPGNQIAFLKEAARLEGEISQAIIELEALKGMKEATLKKYLR